MPRPIQKYKSINAYVPIGLGNIEKLVEGTKFKPDRIRAIYHQLFLNRLADSTNKDLIEKPKFKNGWVSVHSAVFKKVATNEFIEYLNFLEVKGLMLKRRDNITGGKKYTPNSESQQYKIPEQLLNIPNEVRHFKKEKIHDHCTLKSIHILKESYRKSVKLVQLSPIHEQLKEMLSFLRFNTEAAEAYIKKIKSGEIQIKGEPIEKTKSRNYRELLLLMDAVNEGNYLRCSVDLFGERFHTPISNLWKKLRPFIFFSDHEDQPLRILDLSNSQPFFASISIDSNAIGKVLPEYLKTINGLEEVKKNQDFKTFAELCAKGKLYEYWRDIRNFEKNDAGRNIAKAEIFTIMFDKKRKIKNTEKAEHKEFYEMLKQFANHFPSIYKCFNKIKSSDEELLPFIKSVFINEYGAFEGKKSYHKVLASMMQRMESRIMLHRIAPKLIEIGITPFVTVHDSFILPSKYADIALQIIAKEFKMLGIQPPHIKNESDSQ